jgi:transposase-like protein
MPIVKNKKEKNEWLLMCLDGRVPIAKAYSIAQPKQWWLCTRCNKSFTLLRNKAMEKRSS